MRASARSPDAAYETAPRRPQSSATPRASLISNDVSSNAEGFSGDSRQPRWELIRQLFRGKRGISGINYAAGRRLSMINASPDSVISEKFPGRCRRAGRERGRGPTDILAVQLTKYERGAARRRSGIMLFPSVTSASQRSGGGSRRNLINLRRFGMKLFLRGRREKKEQRRRGG
jgi:hypothetical protein